MYTVKETQSLVIDQMCKDFGVKQGQGKAICEAFDISPALVSLMMMRKIPPPQAVLKRMGLKKVVMYVKDEQ